jgi:hypothetical protein
VTHGLAAIAILIATPCAAQQLPTDESSNKLDNMQRVFVKLTDSKQELRGRLLRLDRETLSIQVDDRKVDFPLTRVLRVERTVRDSLWNGAIAGAVWGVACTLLKCGGQAGHAPSSLPRDAFLAAGVGGLLGAGLDAAISRRAVIFDAALMSR